MRKIIALAAIVAASPLLAQEVEFDPAPVLACLESGAGADCIGTAASACTVQPDARDAVECMMAEYAFWNSALRADFQILYEGEIAADMMLADLPRFADRPEAAPLLAAMQGHWQAWRDALCAYEALQGWNTDGEAFNRALCLMHVTGTQVLTLRRLAMGGG
ncbi:MAG: DUF1311 domain-containing protein [Rhodobacteraceae bacterium]|nr:DUF1311 domain-containing protein [Paracoccaceae bacterium]